MDEKVKQATLEALEMRGAGLSVQAIADELQVSLATVYRYLGETGEKVPSGWPEAQAAKEEIIADYLAGVSMSEIVVKYSTTPYCVQRILAAETNLTDSGEARRSAQQERKRTRDELVIKEYKAGKRIVEISAQLGVGQSHIYTILARHGLKPARRAL